MLARFLFLFALFKPAADYIQDTNCEPRDYLARKGLKVRNEAFRVETRSTCTYDNYMLRALNVAFLCA